MVKEAASDKMMVQLPDSIRLQTGDLIVRHGKGFISSAFMRFSQKDIRYSHAGLVCIEHGKTFVYHAIGGEENSSNKLKKDIIEDFCDPGSVYSFGLYRYSLSASEMLKADSLVHMYFNAGLEFDTALDLSTDSKMYCSEFIYKVLKTVAPGKKIIPLSKVSENEYVAIDNLYLNTFCKSIYSHSYQ